MRNSTFQFQFLLFLPLCLAVFGSISAQTSGEALIVIDADLQRQVITASTQDQTINFQHLRKGETYVFTIPADIALGACLPDIALVVPTAEFVEYNPATHTLRFKALSSIAQLSLHYPCSWSENDPPRHYISIVCENCSTKKTKVNQPDFAPIEVTGAGADELVREVFIGGDCFDVENVTFNGGGNQIGKFSSGLTNIGFSDGMIMATGDISVAVGPNDANGAGGGGSGGNDGDLSAIASGPLFDVAAIEFDFTPTQTPLTFQYAFASEEYCEYVNTAFNDVFGFFISGPGIAGTQNLAVIPMSTTPITINSINHVVNSGLYTPNTPSGLDNCENGGVSGTLPPQTPANNAASSELQYDGFTRKMTAIAQVIPCSTYHIKLAIADVGDGVWDSAVFLKSGSFDGGGAASIKWLVNGEPDVNEVVEGCGTVQILVDRVGSNPALPLPVQFTVTGTATSGADFSPIPFTIIIPGGQDQVLFPVNIVNDLLNEGAETIILTLTSPCSCLKPQETLTILDYTPMIPVTDSTVICGPSGAGTVGVTLEGGVEPYSYTWSNGSHDPEITAFVNGNTNYTVTVTDACAKTKTAVARINVNPVPSAQLLGPAPQLCPGQTATLNVNFNGVGPFELTYSVNGNQTTLYDIHDDPYTLVVNQTGLYQIAGIVDSAGCPGFGAGAVTVPASTLSLTGTAAPATCSTLTNGSINTTVVGGQAPYVYHWSGPSNIGNVADPVNILPGNYSLTVTDNYGCNNVQAFVVQSPPALVSNTTVQDVNCFAPNGGSINLTITGGNPGYTYIWSDMSTAQDPVGLGEGTYSVTVTDQTGCTKTASATITGDFTAPTATATVSDEITCITTAVTLDGTGSSSGNGFTYNWAASPGNIVSGGTTLNPVVNQTGNYILTVTNGTNGCTATSVVPVIADNALPTALSGPNGTLTCVVNQITLDGTGSSSGGNFAYHWTASNGGNILSGDSTLNPVVSTTGNYTLVVTNTGNGCSSSATSLVNNNLTLPTATVAPGGQLTCTAPNVQLNGAGSSTGANFTYLWTASGGGIIGSGETTLTPTVTSVGTYTLLITNTINGCTSTASTNVTSNSNVPTSVAAPQGLITCAIPSIVVDATGSSSGSNFSYQWATSNGQILNGQGTLQITAGLPGTYTLLVTNTTNNCSATFSVDVNSDLILPTAEAGAGVTLTCTEPSSTLDGTGSSSGSQYTYFWSAISGGHFVSDSTILNPEVDEPGTYLLLVTNTVNGCTSTDTVIAIPDANDPVAQVAPPATLNCLVSEITLNGGGSTVAPDVVYEWSGPGLVTPPSVLNAEVEEPGLYTLIITNTTNGCSNSTTVLVPQDIAIPPADAGPDAILNCYAPQASLGGTNNPTGTGYTFAWSGTGIVSGGNTPNPVANQSGPFNLVVTNTQNGCTQTDQVVLTEDFVNPQAAAGPGFQLTCTENSYTMQSTASTGPNFDYEWSTATGTFTTATDILNPTVSAAGLYNLLVTNTTNGCTSTSQVQITQAADIPVVVANDAPLLTCATTSLTLSGTGSSTGNEFTYLWSASNGGNIVNGNSTLAPVINEPGTYTLVVTNTTNNCSSNSSVVIGEDVALPELSAGPSPTLTCTSTSLNLAGVVNTPGTFNYSWQAQNNGNIVSGGNTLTPIVNAGGTYILTATSQANGCSNTAQVTVNVDQADPTTAVDNPATLTCAVLQTSLDATGSTTGNMVYTWTASNGGHFVNQTDPLQPVVDAPGNYTLLVTSSINGCTSSQTVTVPQDVVHPVAAAGTDGLLTCAITTLQLNGNGSSQTGGDYSYQWSTSGTGAIQQGATTLTPTISAGGTYTLNVINNVNGCTATDNVLVATNTQPPNVVIATPGLITCLVPQVTLNGSASQNGANISYSWTTPTGGTIVSGASSNSAVVNIAGQYTLTVFNSTNGCSANQTVTVTDNVILPNADAGPSATLTCTVEQVTLAGSGSTGSTYAYAWATTNGQIVSGATTLQPVVNEDGIYTLTVTNTLTGCKQTSVVEILEEKNKPTDFTFDLTKPSCKDNDGVITFETVAGGVGPYLYSINGGQSFSPEIDFLQIAPGTYDLWIQDVNGCEYHEPLTVPKALDPGISIDPTFSIELGDSLTLHALLPSNYPVSLIDTIIWTPIDGLRFNGNTILDLLSPVAKPFKPTQYVVSLISKDGCEASDRVLIKVDNEPHIYIPNAISPWKEDNNNDVFMIFADDKQILQVNKFQVFDRWGEMVFTDSNFQPNDPAHGWGGRLNGKLMTPAVFVYYAEILLIDGRVLLYKGDVTLVR